MATIPPYGWRVPLRSDKPAGAQQMTDLATDIAATMQVEADAATGYTDSHAVSTTPTGSPRRLEADSRVITTDGNGDLVIVFTQPFKAGTNPVVVTMPGDSPGVSGFDTHYLGIVTNTQFQLRGWRPGWTVRVNYIAVGEPA